MDDVIKINQEIKLSSVKKCCENSFFILSLLFKSLL